ncbi:GNAT family N-acetyltransferase [Sulfobacillus harzensis]|uniref:GNAT family N-acetyltransferase n=1 Tax=Sulfobacillus harzensis TaxID=2729629 RepID=A0A7Y0Q290_9FIRM|nr:GNAT family N-acetyltransferase [Sulfobacillus harzensis]NMP22938.1 GNAT family N-acetyltransferase [Sulfobacillus harzensis]
MARHGEPTGLAGGEGIFHWEPMTADDAVAISSWHYPPPYDFYDFDADPDDRAELLDIENWAPNSHWVWKTVVGDRVGFVIFETHDSEVELGLGLSPGLTGQGLGALFMQEILALTRTLWPRHTPCLFVALFNERARTVYERAGFRAQRVFEQETNGGIFLFVAMQYIPQPRHHSPGGRTMS